MVNFGSRRGAANLGFPLMVLTFLMLGGFMYWLRVTAEPTQPPVTEEVAATSDDGFAGTVVASEDLKTGAAAFEGQNVRLAGVTISSTMGAQAFFVDLPASELLPSTPFLVRALPEAGAMLAMGASATVTGVMLAMNDSIVSDWVASGAVSENDRLLIEFATHFIEANQVEITEASGDGASAGS